MPRPRRAPARLRSARPAPHPGPAAAAACPAAQFENRALKEEVVKLTQALGKIQRELAAGNISIGRPAVPQMPAMPLAGGAFMPSQ
jgi:hypothetical protein